MPDSRQGWFLPCPVPVPWPYRVLLASPDLLYQEMVALSGTQEEGAPRHMGPVLIRCHPRHHSELAEVVGARSQLMAESNQAWRQLLPCQLLSQLPWPGACQESRALPWLSPLARRWCARCK